MRKLLRSELRVVWLQLPNKYKTKIWQQAGYRSAQSVLRQLSTEGDTYLTENLQEAVENVIPLDEFIVFYNSKHDKPFINFDEDTDSDRIQEIMSETLRQMLAYALKKNDRNALKKMEQDLKKYLEIISMLKQ